MIKMQYKRLLVAVLLLAACGSLKAQNYSTWGTSHPSPETMCDDYQWPPVVNPCPDVQIKQKHEKTSNYRSNLWNNDPNFPWDTVIDCNTRESGIILSCMPYIPVQYFNGYYAVDTIPYNPPDTTFCFTLGAALANMNDPNKKKMPISADDEFAPSYTAIPYPFYFFGIRKTQFRLGANGLVTFCDQNQFGSGNHCDYNFSAPIPWPDGTSGAPSSDGLARMRDAIYGVFEDTDPAATINNHTNPNYGIYYGVIDEYPCRKIICSWNDMAQFGNNNKHCTYQIVCYEGSNIIEVHVKQREYGSSTSGGRGIIGIQNHTGQAQVKSSNPNDPNYFVINGAPASFFPSNRNTFTSTISHEAYRFTPQGSTQKRYEWFRIFDNGDTVHLSMFDAQHPEARDDTNGYYYPMGSYTSPNPMGQTNTCPTLTRAVVNPTRVSRYGFHLKFQDANSNWYNLFDTIVVGIDTVAHLTIRPANGDTSMRTVSSCANRETRLTMEYPNYQVIDTFTCDVVRRSKGQDISLPKEQCLTLGELTGDNNLVQLPITLQAQLPDTGVVANKIDTIYVYVGCVFASGCEKYDTLRVDYYPNFDITEYDTICYGESYTWNGHTYTQTTTATEHLQSTPLCDSTVHLNLLVLDTSYSLERVTYCKPWTWPVNDSTYSESTRDVINYQNDHGCSSKKELQFTLSKVSPRIQSDREYLDYDHLTANLIDVSDNTDSRVWRLPDGSTRLSSSFDYTIPAEYEEADIWLYAQAPIQQGGCIDSTHIVIPLHKETFYMPNIFTPGRGDEVNRYFGSISTHTIKEEMHIYNRNGMLVFHCETPDCKWDGRDMNGNECPQGTYTYLIRYSNDVLPKVTHVLHGTVTLIR
ncbi:MAG: gliding motility-associated C-terminal domain-containing protein [Bacteroidales bacterium]|nr:gliding motility-associated C-terminal domain-containing protein [Bacteroidales bacterium]